MLDTGMVVPGGDAPIVARACHDAIRRLTNPWHRKLCLAEWANHLRIADQEHIGTAGVEAPAHLLDLFVILPACCIGLVEPDDPAKGDFGSESWSWLRACHHRSNIRALVIWEQRRAAGDAEIVRLLGPAPKPRASYDALSPQCREACGDRVDDLGGPARAAPPRLSGRPGGMHDDDDPGPAD
jgi:hypothetical protein